MEDAKTRTNMTGCNRAASIKYLLFLMLVLTGRTALGAPAPMQVGGNLSGLEILDTASSTVAALSSYILQIDTTATVTSPQLTPETITVTDFHGVWFQKPYNLYWYGKAGSASVATCGTVLSF